MNTRDVRVVYPEHRDGQPWRVRVEHRPSGLHTEGVSAVSCAEAHALAMEALEREVAVVEQAGGHAPVGRA